MTYLPAGDSVAGQVQTVADAGGSRVHLRETGYFGPSPNGQQAQQGRTGGAESPNSRQVQQGRTGATPGDCQFLPPPPLRLPRVGDLPV